MSGLLAWYRADRGITLDTGVSAWASQAGSEGLPLVQATPIRQPTWSSTGWGGALPAVKTDGLDDFLLTSALALDPDNFVIAGAMQWVSATNTCAAGLGSPTDNSTASLVASSAAAGYALIRSSAGGNRVTGLTVAATTTARGLWVLNCAGATATLTVRGTAGTVNKTVPFVSGASDYSRCCVGALYRIGLANNFAAANVSEVIVASAVTDITALLDDMESRWPLS